VSGWHTAQSEHNISLACEVAQVKDDWRLSIKGQLANSGLREKVRVYKEIQKDTVVKI